MKRGPLSVSLAVGHRDASSKFHEKLGFKVFPDAAARNRLIMKNGGHAIGLFQAVFDTRR
jgi:hypothetical protein